MILLDANLLLYAYDANSPLQKKAARWLEGVLGGNDAVGLPWVSAWAFVRIATNARVQETPLGVEEALGVIRGTGVSARAVKRSGRLPRVGGGLGRTELTQGHGEEGIGVIEKAGTRRA